MTIEKRLKRICMLILSMFLAFSISAFSQEAKELDPKGSDNINETLIRQKSR
jgi:hypothetical protein